MKTFVLGILLILVSGPSWYTDFEKAKQLAHDEKKMILLNFSGSDWCNPCIKMKAEIFSNEAFISYADQNLVLLQADFPRTKKNQLDAALVKHNEALAEKYNPAGKFPFTLLLDSEGRVIKTWDGYRKTNPDTFVSEIRQHVPHQ